MEKTNEAKMKAQPESKESVMGSEGSEGSVVVGLEGSESIKLIGKGSYGCVFKPTIKCSDDTSSSSIRDTYVKYISKIQLLENYVVPESNNPDWSEVINNDEDTISFIKETIFGRIVQTFPNYYMYFSPILASCPVDINILSMREVEKCGIFNHTTDHSDSTRNYVNSKIRFIEGNNMLDYFFTLIKNGESNISPFFVKKFTQSYSHLIKAIRILQSSTDSNDVIIHYDLKNNNIIYDEKRGVPIIIDFGLSFNKKMLIEFDHPKVLNNVFYYYDEKYVFWWSIDVIILSYITQRVLIYSDKSKDKNGDDQIKEIYEKGMVDVAVLKKVCDNNIDNNEILKWIGGSGVMKNKWHSYIDSFEGKVWKEFIVDLSLKYERWDIYSLSICFLEYIYELGILDDWISGGDQTKQFIEILLKNTFDISIEEVSIGSTVSEESVEGENFSTRDAEKNK